MCKDLWANISKRAKICCGPISVKQRSVGKYHETCKDIWANISRCAKIFWQISANVQRSVVAIYHQTCKYIWADISRCAKIFGQISADTQKSVLRKYHKTFEDLWANISRHWKISGHRVVWAQNTITTLCSTSDTIWLPLIDQFYWERKSVDLNFALLQLVWCSHLLSADMACL